MGFFSGDQEAWFVTWREKLERELSRHGETFQDVEHIYPDESVLDVPFEDGFGLAEGPEFFVFTTHRVYFPICYGWSEWVGSVPRHPEYIRPEDGKHHGG